MSQYLLSFAKNNIENKSNAYIAIFWCIYKQKSSTGRYSEHIKDYLTSVDNSILGKDFQKLARRIKIELNKKPELDWITPTGLKPVKQLRVKNFRGFGAMSEEDAGTEITFSKLKNIFFAPNGGGKTSLCEALEYGMTGSIKEASRRRTTVNKYAYRHGKRSFLRLTDKDNADIIKNISWSNCFIDRNRLQEFSLLGSKDTGSTEKDVVANLFGLEDLQQVISRFVQPRNFNISQVLRPSSADITKKIQNNIDDLNNQLHEQNILIDHHNKKACTTLGLNFSNLQGVRNKYTLINKLIRIKNQKIEHYKSLKEPYTIKPVRVTALARLISYILKDNNSINEEFSKNIEQVNYSAVFESISTLEHNFGKGDFCPACMTQLSYVKIDPYEHAKNELVKLKHLDELNKKRNVISERINAISSFIEEIITSIKINTNNNIKFDVNIANLELAISANKHATTRHITSAAVLSEFVKLKNDQWNEINKYINRCIDSSDDYKAANSKMSQLHSDINHLEKIIAKLNELGAEKKLSQERTKTIRKNIRDAMNAAKEIAKTIAENDNFNKFALEIQTEYENFYNDLLEFKMALERDRVQGIEEFATNYYRLVNNHDSDHEQIESVLFEQGESEYRIKITRPDGLVMDAFTILSEGHLMALGLSILLALAKKNNYPLIVFDDVVNAIDSEHRANIIDLLFNDKYLRKTQLIVTTHDRLFWERFCNHFEKSSYADQCCSTILDYTNMGIVRLDYSSGFRGKIESALKVYDIRQALIYCRIWFETLIVDFCIEKGVAITAKFTNAQRRKNNELQISLEKTFELAEPYLDYNSTFFNFIKNDLINWSGQNQEHHAFDEFGFNFSHAKTSMEVREIYDAICFVECQLFLQKKKKINLSDLSNITQEISRIESKLEQMLRAPEIVRIKMREKLDDTIKKKDRILSELYFIEECESTIGE